jgi:glycosyltransferase involved in cell wall biosynthesis
MKLSIITVNRNNATGLEKTIQSVVSQTATDFEYIVIDGASNDGSVDVIKKYADKITYWVSEPDSGIYNAMNKGIRKTRGEYCLFLNSADWLIESGTLANVFADIAELPDAGVYYSDIILSDGYLVVKPNPLTINHLIHDPLNHQNTLIKRALFFEHSLYNEKLKIVSDWEFLLKELWAYKTIFLHIKTKIAIYDITGISSQGSVIHQQEIITIYKNVFSDFSETIIELRKYRNSVYESIINELGYTKLLEFILRCYRFLMKRIKRRTPIRIDAVPER